MQPRDHKSLARPCLVADLEEENEEEEEEDAGPPLIDSGDM